MKAAKEFYLEALKGGVCTVTFEKVNGSERVMRCTRDVDVIPTEYHPNGNGKAVSENVIAAFDVDKQAWRVFRVDKVKEFVFHV